MFSLFRRDPIRKLERQVQAKYKEAKDAQRFGDRGLEADLYAEAEALAKELERLRTAQS